MAVFSTGGIAPPPRIAFVEYIESTGAQRIDTGFAPNNNTRVVIEAVVPSVPSGTAWLCGSRETSSSGRCSIYIGDTYFKIGHGNTTASSGRVASANTRYTIDRNKNVINVNGTSGSAIANTFQNTRSIYIFAENRAGTAMEPLSYRLYSCQIYDNGTLVRDYWPCYDQSGVACLYDKVNKEYVYNAGTGEFIAGVTA